MASPLSSLLSPENEVLNFKQREGENLKDAWYRICNAQNRSTRKQSTSVLLHNFYVGITPWNRCVLDTVTGGDFLSSHTFDAYNAMLDLFGPPPLLVNGIKNISITRSDANIKIAKEHRSGKLPSRSILSIANSIPSVF